MDYKHTTTIMYEVERSDTTFELENDLVVHFNTNNIQMCRCNSGD